MTKNETLKLAVETLKRIDEVAPTAMAKLVIPEIEQALEHSDKVFDPDYNYERDMRNRTLDEVAKAVYDFKSFEKDTMDSFAIYIRSMKR